MVKNRKQNVFRSQTFETGFSDFHHMIYTMLKTEFNKVPPKVATYLDYSKVPEVSFLIDLSNTISDNFPANYHIFESLTAHVLEKKAIIRESNKRHVSKELRKEIMHRSRL